MLSREAADTTKGDPEHTGAVHGSQCTECRHSELILRAHAVTLMWGCKNKGVYSLWLHVPWKVGMALFGESDLHQPWLLPYHPPALCSQAKSALLTQPSSSCLQITARQALDREISGPRSEEF